MRASINIDLTALWAIVNRLKDPTLAGELSNLSSDKGVAAIMSQGIAANFNDEGPGWPPLKPRTIRGSVSESQSKKVGRLSDKELLEREQLTRQWKGLKPHEIKRLESLNKKAKIKNKTHAATEPSRRILQGSGLLRNSVTTVGAQGNIYQPQQNKLIWGTDLAYAAIHNRGGVIQHPGTKNGFGMGVVIPPHSIRIPRRRFLYLQQQWLEDLRVYVVGRARELVMRRIRG